MKSRSLLFSCLLGLAVLVADTTVSGQNVSDSVGTMVIPFFDRPIDPDKYLIRPGEQLEVVFINAQLSPLPLFVDAESRIVHQKLGIFDLAGRTLSETRQLLLEPLSRLFNADKIDISIRRVYPVTVRVTGAVRKPGRYVGYTSQKVSDIIDSAGGVLPEGSTRNISFISGSGAIPVDLDRAGQGGNYGLNPHLYAGDRIHVPVASEDRVYVMGEVVEPRSIELLPGDDLQLLVTLAGGVQPWGDIGAAYVLGDSIRDIHSTKDIRKGDFIVVPRSSITTEHDNLTVLGAVRNPGKYAWSPGITVEDIQRTAGGLTEKANADRIVVFRRAKHEVLGTPLPERFPLFLGGSNPAGSLTLEPADSVVVANLVGFVRVSGAVTNPGVYPFESGQNAAHYISLAGGIINGLQNAELLFHDRVSNLTRAGELRGPVYDGLEIMVRPQELGQ